MTKFIENTIKATIINVIVALFIAILFVLAINMSVGAQITELISIANKITIDTENKQVEPTIMTKENKIQNYPEYATNYATIHIPKIDVNLPVYYGDTLEILKNGLGHSS